MNAVMMMLFVKMQQAKQHFLEEERGAVDIVAIVVLIGVAVALALFFKDQIAHLLDVMFDNIGDAASGATSQINI